MHYFSFNGINSTDLGITVKNMPLLPRAERDIETINVSGRNGNLHIDNGTFRSNSYTISCIIEDITKIDSIKSTFIGTGKLILSKYSDRYFIATIKNQISFDKYLNYLQEFPLQFDIEPIAYHLTDEILEYTSSNASFDIGGNVEVAPKMTITGTGTVTLNGVSVQVAETGIEIDCELMNCTKEGLNKNDKVTLDSFPKLNPSENSITLGNGISKVKLVYKRGWL